MQKLKILVLGDIHNSNEALRAINSHLGKFKYDLIICTGDVISRPNKNAADFFKKFIHIVTDLHKTKLYMVHGNNEDEDMIALMNKKKVLIHLKNKKFKGYKFFGVGGWMDDLTDMDKLQKSLKNAILITHLPPKMAPKLPGEQGRQIKGNAPKIHLCGHIHSSGSIWRIGGTLVVKIPSAMYLKAAVLELPEKNVKFINL